MQESDAPGPSSSPLIDMARTLDSLEPIVLDAQKSLQPQRKVRKSLLSELPRPSPRVTPAPVPLESPATATERDIGAGLLAGPTDDLLLLSPAEQQETSSSRPAQPASLPTSSSSIPTATTATTSAADPEKRELELSAPRSNSSTTIDQTNEKEKSSTSDFLSTSMRTQEELSAQLAQMATQLKMNSLHFTEALARDRAVMEGAEEKLGVNLGRMKTERKSLGIVGATRGGTTWLLLFALIVVGIAWVFMFLIIRLT
ncbi:hypothetical protein DL93DRAFT_2073353 [Clavulina sp. PMI_390]|nr:hypothetical protein DL93DRAFT_2073353 [Clavulina sp. PMI_390]